MTLRRHAAERRLGKLLKRHTSGLDFPRAGRVEGRNADGTTVIRYLDGSCDVRLGITGARTGQVITEAPAVTQSRGTAGVARIGLAGSLASLWVESVSPFCLIAGDPVTVAITGRGFTTQTAFVFLLSESPEPNPYITIVRQQLLDSEHVELDLEVDPAAPVFEQAGLAYGSAPESLPHIKPDAYCIEQGEQDVGVGWYFYYLNGSTWRCFAHTADGLPLEEVGSSLPATEGFEGDFQGCIPQEAGYHRAARLLHTSETLWIYDFAAESVIRYDVSEDWAAGPAQWVAGAFHWIEWQPVFAFDTQVRLMRADRDFENPTEVGSMMASFFILGFWEYQFVGPDFSETGAAIWIEHVSEQQFYIRVGFDYTGLGSQGPAQESKPTSQRAGWPIPSGRSLRLGRSGRLESWDGQISSGYEPWNPDHLGDVYQDLFVEDGKIYVSGGLSTPINPTAEVVVEIEHFVPALGNVQGFCRA